MSHTAAVFLSKREDSFVRGRRAVAATGADAEGMWEVESVGSTEGQLWARTPAGREAAPREAVAGML